MRCQVRLGRGAGAVWLGGQGRRTQPPWRRLPGSSLHRTAALLIQGVAKFLDYPEVDAGDDRLKTTGFLPATNAAFKYLTDEGYYAQNPKTAVAIGTLANGKQGGASGGFTALAAGRDSRLSSRGSREGAAGKQSG